MKRADRVILLGLVILGALGAFWFLLLAPKRDESSKLGDEVAVLRTQVQDAKQQATAAEAARKDFDANYRQLVVLGKAVPAGDDTPSLMSDLQILSHRSDVSFRSIAQSDAAASATTPTATAAPTSTSTSSTTTDTSSSSDTSSTDSSSTDTSSTDSSSTATTTASTSTAPAAPTEASAAALPIGSTVGPAGLPVMPYALEFKGGFFEVADFLGRLDDMVHTKGQVLGVRGRLLTIDGFSLTLDPSDDPGSKGPTLKASLAATSYLTPADQGLVAGATPTAPAPATSTATPTTTTSTGDSTSLPAATATPAP